MEGPDSIHAMRYGSLQLKKHKLDLVLEDELLNMKYFSRANAPLGLPPTPTPSRT